MKAAEQLLRESFSLPAHGELAEFGRKQWPEFLLARGRAQEAFDQSQILLQSPSTWRGLQVTRLWVARWWS